MKHALSTHLFVNHRLTSVWLDRIWDAGVPAVEIFCAKQHLDWRDQGQVNELGHWFRDSELKLHSLHAPMYTDEVWGRSGPQAALHITEPLKSKRIGMVDEIKRALEIAENIPFRYMVQHLGGPAEEYDERKMEAAFTSLEELTVFARQRGVEILLENIPNGFSSAAKIAHLSRADASGSELLLRYRPRQHHGGRRDCVRRHEDAHPLHAHPRQQRQGGQAPVPVCRGRRHHRLATRPCACSLRVRSNIRCCWN